MKKTILAIGAHPDDIEIGCAGSLALLKSQGHNLVYLIVTSGEEGMPNPQKEMTRQRREEEALAAAKVLGVQQVIFFREPDGLTGFSKETKIRLIQVLRELRPQAVFTHAASDHFPDHRVAHELTKSALLGAAGPWYPDAKGEPHQVQEVYGYEVWNPIPFFQKSVSIGDSLELKLQALRKHVSQLAKVDYADAVEGLARYRGTMSMTGKYAEVFEVLRC